MLNFRKLLKAEDGVAAVEFAIWMVFAVPLFIAAADFSLYNIDRIDLNKANGEAAIFVFNNRDAIDDTIGATLQDIIVQASGLAPEDVTVTTTCNGSSTCTDTGRVLACLGSSGAGGQPEFSSNQGGFQLMCANGTSPGYFLTFDVVADLDPIFESDFLPQELRTTLTVKLE